MTAGMVIGTMNVVQSIAAYFGLIDTLSSDVSKLVHQSFKSARMNLELVQTSDNSEISKDYIKEAKNKFIEAVAVEKNENLISAYAGLAMCQYLLGDNRNAQSTYGKIKDVMLSKSEKVASGAKGTITKLFFQGVLLE